MALNDNPNQQPIDSRVGVSHKKRWILVGAAVVLLIAVVVLSFWMLRKEHDDKESAAAQKVAVSQVCSRSVIRSANKPLADSDQVALAPVVSQITALKDFDHDPNCLYIVLQYDLGTSDAKASRDTLNKLERVYDPVVGFSSAFTVSLMPISALRENVSFLEENAKQAQENEKLGDQRVSEGSDAADKFQQEHNK